MLFYVVVVLLVSIRFVRAAGSFTFSHTVREAGGIYVAACYSLAWWRYDDCHDTLLLPPPAAATVAL